MKNYKLIIAIIAMATILTSCNTAQTTPSTDPTPISTPFVESPTRTPIGDVESICIPYPDGVGCVEVPLEYGRANYTGEWTYVEGKASFATFSWDHEAGSYFTIQEIELGRDLSREDFEIAAKKEVLCHLMAGDWFLYQRKVLQDNLTDEQIVILLDGLAALALSPEEQASVPLLYPEVYGWTEEDDEGYIQWIPGNTTCRCIYGVFGMSDQGVTLPGMTLETVTFFGCSAPELVE